MITNKDKTKYIDLIFMFFGIIFVCVGIGIGVYYLIILQNCVEVEGTIISLHGKKTLIGYEVNGKYYSQYLNDYQSNYHIGKELELFYSTKSGLVYSKISVYLLPGIFTFIGLIFSIVGCVIIYNKYKNKKMLKNRQQYIKKLAKVVDIKMNRFYSVNNKHPYQLFCEVNYDGEKLKIKSPNFWDKVNYEKNYVVDVYFKNKKKYVVDVVSYRKDELFYEMEEFY